MGNRCKVNYTLTDLREHFSYNPTTGELIRTKRNKGQKIRPDQEKVCVFLNGKRVELGVNKLCFSLGYGRIPKNKVRRLSDKTKNPLKLNNLVDTVESKDYDVSILPNGKNQELTKVRWRVGTKYAQKTFQTPSEAVWFSRKKEEELKNG